MLKSKLVLLLSTSLIALSVIFMAACHKNSSNAATDTGFSNDQATADKAFEDAQTASDQAAATPNGSMTFRTTATTGSPCATITHSVANSGTYTGDNLITIDFGATDCTCLDGRVRRGQILVYYTGAYADSGTVIYITFNNFYQNGNQVTGLKTVTNMGTNASGQKYFNVTVNGSVILASGAGTISETSSRVRTWVSEGNPNIYQITGTATITRANGSVVNCTVPTATPLVFYSNCRWIEAGTISYTLSNGLTASMNYGNTANCDDQATLTYNGRNYNITLR